MLFKQNSTLVTVISNNLRQKKVYLNVKDILKILTPIEVLDGHELKKCFSKRYIYYMEREAF